MNTFLMTHQRHIGNNFAPQNAGNVLNSFRDQKYQSYQRVDFLCAWINESRIHLSNRFPRHIDSHGASIPIAHKRWAIPVLRYCHCSSVSKLWFHKISHELQEQFLILMINIPWSLPNGTREENRWRVILTQYIYTYRYIRSTTNACTEIISE